MSVALRNQLLLVLEKAAREEIDKYLKHMDKPQYPYLLAKCDISASAYGARVPRLCYLTGWSGARIRYHLDALVENGTVLKHQYKAGGPARWWPVGLFEKMHKEHAK